MIRTARSTARVAVALAVSLLIAEAGFADPASLRAGEPTPAPAAETAAPTGTPPAEPATSFSPEPTPAPTAPAPAPTDAPPATPTPGATPAPTPGSTPEPTSAPTPEPTATPAPSASDAAGLPPLPAGATELVERRTEYSRTFRDVAGKRTTEFYTSPLFYRPAGSETLEPVVLGFRPSADPAFTAVSDRAPVTVAVGPATGKDGFLLTATGPYRVAFRLPDDQAKQAGTAAPVLSGPVADYADFLPGVDLRVIAGTKGARSFFIWHEIPKDPTLRYEVDAPGLALKPSDDGSIALVDAAGVTVARIPRPYAVDSTPDERIGSGRFTDRVTLSLAEDGRTLTVAVDPDWLASAVYPVYVDPSTGWLYNAGSSSYGDAHIASYYPTLNFDDYQRPDSPYYHELWNGTDPGDLSGISYDFLRWNVSVANYGAIDAATLRLFPYHQYYNSPTQETTYARRVTESWTEGGVKWNNKPSYTSTGKATEGCVEGDYCDFDVKAIVQVWAITPSTNDGFQVDTIGKGATYWKRFISSEQGGDHRPKLSITYHSLTTTGTTPAYAGAVSWTFADGNGHPQAKYHVDVATTSAFTTIVADSGEVASSANAWTVVPTTPGGMTDGTAYYYRVKASDGAGWSNWSTTGTFTWDAYRRGDEAFYTRVPFDAGGGWALDVGVHNGEARLSRGLFSIPSFGPAAGLDLTYSSLDLAAAGPFGYGWSSNLSQRLSFPTGLVIWHRPDGGRVAFAGSDASGWTVVPGHFETLTKSGSEYTVTEKDQTKTVFDSTTGKLTRIENRFGKALTIAYPTGQITATDASSRTTTLTVTGSLVTVVDGAGRTWSCVITNGDLTSISEPDPDGAGPLAAPATTLAYTSHRLITVSRTRRTAAGGSDTLVWSVGYNATTGKAETVTDAVANASYPGVSHTFTYGATTDVGLLKTYSPVVRNTTTYTLDPYGRPISITDPNGFVTNLAWDDPASTLHSVDTPLDASTWITTAYTYDAAGNVLTETADVTGDPIITRYEYNGANDITKTYVADGTADEVETTQEYDAAGHLVKVTENAQDPVAKMVTEYAYTAHDEVGAERDPSGTVTTHAYDANGNETQTVSNCTNTGTTPPGDPAWKTCAATGTHDTATNVTTSSVFSLTTTQGKLGLPDSTTDGTGRTTTFAYDILGRTTIETPPEGATTHEWDQLGNEIRTTAPGSLVTTRVLDLANRATTETAPGPRVTTTTYDAAGNVTEQVIAGDKVSRTYDGNGLLLAETVDPGSAPHLNLVTQHAYDGSGQETASRDPALTVRRTWYDEQGRVTKVVENCTNTGTTVPGDPDWKTCAGTGTKDATWNLTTTYAYDDRGNKTSEVAPNGRVTTFVYDDLDRLTKQIDNDVASPTLPSQDVITEYAYDADGNQAAAKIPTNAGGASGYVITRYLRDALGRVSSEIANCTNSGTTPPGDPDWKTCAGTGTANASTNVVTSYTYDAEGRRLSIVAPDPSAAAGSLATTTTRFAYDAAGRLCRVLENASVDLQGLADPCSTPVSGSATTNVSTRYTYDAAGRLGSMIDGRGNTTGYGYDPQGRMTSLVDASPATLAWGYNDTANTKTQTNRTDTTPATPTITWTYDAAGRLASRAYLDDAGNPRTTTYGYDAAGYLASAVDGGSSIGVTNDRLGRPTSVTVTGDAAATTTYGYSFTAPTRTDASGAYTMAVDPFGRVTSLTDPIHASPFSWTYGADGQPMTAAAPNGNSTSFAYDPLGRLLTKVTGTRASYTWTYNRAGNRLTEASTITSDTANGTATFGYDPLDRLNAYSLPGIRTIADTWQAVPNRDTLTVDGVPSSQSFSTANRPDSNGYASDADGRMTARPGTSGGYLEWDSLGRLIRVRLSQGGAIVAQYTYDALDRLLIVERSGGRIRFRYQGSSTAVAGVVDDIGGSVIRNVATGPDGTVLEDWLGTSRRIYGTNGHRDLTWTADDTGAVTATVRYDPWGNAIRTSGTLPDWRFQGSWYDTSSDLSWAIARWYSPALGRFISEDTLLGQPEAPASRHLYAYGEGDPVGAWDPEGEYELTLAERKFCSPLEHKLFCAVGLWQADWATAEVWRRFNTNKDDIPANAFKHCIWAGGCTLDMGPGLAKRITDNHENWVDGRFIDRPSAKSTLAGAKEWRTEVRRRAMDLRNNRVGIYLALKLLSAYRNDHEKARGQLSNACYHALFAGLLVYLKGSIPGQPGHGH